MTAPNISLLLRTLAAVERNPREWDQRFAQHAVVLAETQPETSVDEDVTDADNRARELLGLTVAEAGHLFDPFNTVDDLRRLVGELCEVTR